MSEGTDNLKDAREAASKLGKGLVGMFSRAEINRIALAGLIIAVMMLSQHNQAVQTVCSWSLEVLSGNRPFEQARKELDSMLSRLDAHAPGGREDV